METLQSIRSCLLSFLFFLFFSRARSLSTIRSESVFHNVMLLLQNRHSGFFYLQKGLLSSHWSGTILQRRHFHLVLDNAWDVFIVHLSPDSRELILSMAAHFLFVPLRCDGELYHLAAVDETDPLRNGGFGAGKE